MAETQEKQVHRHLTIESILGMFPHKAQRLAQEITNAGLHCIGCGAATWETLEGGMLGHGKTDEEIDELVRRLNALLEEEEEQQRSDTITLTARAASKYQSILEEEEKQGWGVRLAEEMQGCSGFQYVLDYSESARPDDTVFESHGIEIHVSNALVDRLMGAEIDFIDGLHGSGFKVSNPNVRSACGCGSSHGY